MEKQILSVLVKNHAGVLSRVSGLFSRRGFNIHSVASGVTQDPNVTRLTIVVDDDEQIVDQVCKQLHKIIEVLKVHQLNKLCSVVRELALIKVNATPETRSETVQIAEIFRSNIVDVTPETLTIEVSGPTAKIDALCDMVRSAGIREIVRTGTIDMERGSQILSLQEEEE